MNQIVELIPRAERREILEGNIIALATGVAGDPYMYHLMVIWRTYVEPALGNCPLCITRVLNNWRELQPTLIEAEKNDNLINET